MDDNKKIREILKNGEQRYIDYWGNSVRYIAEFSIDKIEKELRTLFESEIAAAFNSGVEHGSDLYLNNTNKTTHITDYLKSLEL